MARKSTPKYPVVKNRSRDTYVLTQDIFMGDQFGEGGVNCHFTVRQNWNRLFRQFVDQIQEDANQGVKSYVIRRALPTYTTKGFDVIERAATFHSNTGAVVVGCNEFSKTTAKRIATWAGISKYRRDILWPKETKNA